MFVLRGKHHVPTGYGMNLFVKGVLILGLKSAILPFHRLSMSIK
jgi:hypothetical protein